MSALKTYLNNREDLKDIAPSMLEAAQNLLTDDQEIINYKIPNFVNKSGI
jgi:exonuclease SbcD